MSSSIRITFPPEQPGLRPDDWAKFAEGHGLRFEPGNGLFYLGQVEVDYRTKRNITFSTYYMGAAMPEVARLALDFWATFGGTMTAATELTQVIARGYKS